MERERVTAQEVDELLATIEPDAVDLEHLARIRSFERTFFNHRQPSYCRRRDEEPTEEWQGTWHAVEARRVGYVMAVCFVMFIVCFVIVAGR